MVFCVRYKRELIKSVVIITIIYILHLWIPLFKFNYVLIVLMILFLSLIIEIMKRRKYVVNNKNLEIYEWGKCVEIPLKSIKHIKRHQEIITTRRLGGVGGFQYSIIYNGIEYELSNNLFNNKGKTIIEYLNKKHNKPFKESLGARKIF